MALRLGLKINRIIFPELSRSLSVKADLSQNVTETTPTTESKEHQKPDDGRHRLGQQNSIHLNKKFSSVNFPAEIGKIRLNIEEQKLQPAMLPNYYTKSLEFTDTLKIDDMKEGEKKDSFRNFEQSKTYAKVQLPLRASKLANPFPDPVKVMASHTVSDEEKAAQMFADSRAPKYSTGQVYGLPNFKTKKQAFSTTSMRYYSKKKKCGGQKPKDCAKMFLPGCERPQRETCERVPSNKKCKKQEAPYPSYSESCHEDIIERPTECKMCPWNPSSNPNFKPKKRKIHTDLSTRETSQPPNIRDHETEYEEEESTNFQKGRNTNFRYRLANNEAVSPSINETETDEDPNFWDKNFSYQKVNRNVTNSMGPDDSYQCNMKKPPCQVPPPSPCNLERIKRKKREEKKYGNTCGNNKKPGKKNKKKKKAKPRFSFNELRALWFNKAQIAKLKAQEKAKEKEKELYPSVETSIFPRTLNIQDHEVSKLVADNMMQMKKKDKTKKKPRERKPKCQKYKLPKPKKTKKPGCPPKKKPKPIKDCPPSPGGCGESEAANSKSTTYFLEPDKALFDFPPKIVERPKPKCPPKEKRKVVRDCPPEGCGKNKYIPPTVTDGLFLVPEKTLLNDNILNASASNTSARDLDYIHNVAIECKKKKKCPHVDHRKIKIKTPCPRKNAFEYDCPKVEIKIKRRKLTYKRGKHVKPEPNYWEKDKEEE